ncbi:MAG: hypothetical protein LBV27_05700, partial [Oscillospiraceae bacterium]|nr:hypothetical protein [Oscillospiraceae bacterium]
MTKKIIRYGSIVFLILIVLAVSVMPVSASQIMPDVLTVGGGAGSVDPNISININGGSSDAVRILLLMTILTLLPSILIMMTCFTRI